MKHKRSNVPHRSIMVIVAIAGKTRTCIPENIVAIATSAASLIVLKLHVAT